MRDVIFTNEHFYHIYNRGVDKRDIFMDDTDRWRFIKSLCIFNDRDRYEEHSIARKRNFLKKNIKPFVKIHAFCLMTNHYHLLIEQVIDGGIVEFMKRVSMGYAKYFNKRNERTGKLYEGAFKAKHIESDNYLLQLSRYIHRNPIHLLTADQQLSNYFWSSYSDHINQPKLKFLITEFILDQFKNKAEYKNFVENQSPASYQIGHLLIDE